MDYWAEYHRWIENAVIDQDLSIELNSMTPEQVEDAFYRELARWAGVSLEQALADALFKLAGELSLHALHRAGEKQCNKD